MDVAAERARFEKVMHARKAPIELVELVDRLTESTKFAISAKPYCFADLVVEAGKRMDATSMPTFLAALQSMWVGDIIRGAYGSQADGILCRFVRRVVDLSPTTETMCINLEHLISAGIVSDFAHAFELTKKAGLFGAGLKQLEATQQQLSQRAASRAQCPF